MKKRMISLLLALVMVLGLIPAIAPAASAASNIVAKVEAVGTGYAYDSEAGAFAPTFSSMTAYDPGGNAIDIEGFVWSSPFYTKANFGSANRLFHEPEGGETYYFAICVDQYVNEEVQYDYAYPDFYKNSTALIPGFDVEFYNLMEREMGGYLELTFAATRKYHVVEVGDTKLYHGDTYQGSKGGTLTVDGYNVTMNNFKDSSSVYFANPNCKAYYEENRPVFSDMIETLKLTIIGENSVGAIDAMRDLKIYGTMYDSLTIQGRLDLLYYDSPPASSTDGYKDWDCWIYGGNYKMNEIDFHGFYKTRQGLLIFDGASVEVSGEVNVSAIRVEHSKLAAGSIYCAVNDNNATVVQFKYSRIALNDRMYHRRWSESDVWAEIYGGAFKGKTDYIEISIQERESFDCLDFRHYMVGTGSVGSLSGDIKIGGCSYHPSYKPFPYDYIDVECKDARSIACKNATASAETAVPGTAVTITADPAPEGKVFYRWEIKGLIKDIANPYSPTTTFTMDVADVQAIATYKDAGADDQPTNPFTDVKEGDFFYDPVMWAVENGITTGATATTFNPGGTCLRAQVVTFLHRAAGNPEPTSTKNPFTDVKSTDFFYKPVLWAVEKGITNGTTATTFGSYDNCNRAAVVTFLWRNAGSPEPKSTKNPFVDVKSTDFFYKPVLWAVEQGITNGLDATHFGPATACNRAQVVTFLYRAYN